MEIIKNISINEIKNSRTEEKKKHDKLDIWVYYFARPVSNYLTWLLLKLGVSPAIATLLSLILGVLGCGMILTPYFSLKVLGVVFINLWLIMDCVDGNIARVLKITSKFGSLIDAISGYAFGAVLFITLGLYTYLYEDLLFFGKIFLVVLGSLTSIFYLLPRLIEHKSKNLFNSYDSILTDKTQYSIVKTIAHNVVAPSGFLLPIVAFGVIFEFVSWIVFVYSILYLLLCLYTVYSIIMKTSKLN